MTADDVTREIRAAYPEAEAVVASGGTFFFNDPSRHFPFATLVVNDEYDLHSDLNRDGVYRLNLGVGKATYQALFPPTAERVEHDFMALDRLLPHPTYGSMYWVCVLCPSEATFEGLRPLLTEAWALSLERYGARSPA